MTRSPLYPYINCSGLYTGTYQTGVTAADGRLVPPLAYQKYYLRLFLKRAQSSGTDSGSKEVPNGGGRSNIMPGYSGQAFIYRGYVIQYSDLGVSSTFKLGDDPSSITLTDVNDTRPEWLTVGGSMQILFGDIREVINCKMITSGGVYGSQGIDELITTEMGGVPIILLGGNYTAS